MGRVWPRPELRPTNLNDGPDHLQWSASQVDLAGNVLRDISVEKLNQGLVAKGYTFSISDFHHDVIVLPSGHWITLANTSKEFTNLRGYPGITDVLGDALIDIDLNGNVVWAWSSFDHLDVNRTCRGCLTGLTATQLSKQRRCRV